MKRIIIKKHAPVTVVRKNASVVRRLPVGVKGLQHCRFEEHVSYSSLYKKGVKDGTIKIHVKLDELPLDHLVSDEKKRDVDKLLGVMFGPEWKTLPGDQLEFYKNILQSDVNVGAELIMTLSVTVLKKILV